MNLHATRALLCTLCTPCITSLSQAQPYPAKIIRVINPAAPGGNNDLLFRTLAPKMVEQLGQQLVMDYRPGAGASVGTELLARSAPGGYSYTTMITAASHVMNPAIVKKLPYDTLKDFTMLGLIADIPSALVTHPSLPARDVQQLIMLSRTHPGTINFSSGGHGTVGHLAGALFGAMAKARYTFVAYKGSHQALIDVMAGHIQFQFSSISNLLPYVQAGKLNILAQTGETFTQCAAISHHAGVRLARLCGAQPVQLSCARKFAPPDCGKTQLNSYHRIT